MAAVRPSPITISTAVAFFAFVFLLEVSNAQTPSTLSETDIPAADAAAVTLPTSAVKVNFIEATLLNTDVPESADPITVRSVPLMANNTVLLPSSNGAEKKDGLDPVSSVIAVGLPRHHDHKDDDEEGFSKYSLKRSYMFLEEKVKKHFNPEDKDDDRDDNDSDDDSDGDDDDNDDHDSDDDRDDEDRDDEEEKEKKKEKK